MIQAPPPPPPEPSIFESDLLIYLVVGLLLIGAAGGGFVFWRRRKSGDSATQFDSRLAPDSFFGGSGGQRIDTGAVQSSLLADRGGDLVAHSAVSAMYSPGQSEAGDIDPVAEAEVYLAYGKHDEAERILKERLNSHPKDVDVMIKLLEIQVQRKDSIAVSTLMPRIKAATGGTGRWADAESIAAILKGGAGAASRESESLENPMDSIRSSSVPTAADNVMDMSGGMDFNFNSSMMAPPTLGDDQELDLHGGASNGMGQGEVPGFDALSTQSEMSQQAIDSLGQVEVPNNFSTSADEEHASLPSQEVEDFSFDLAGLNENDVMTSKPPIDDSNRDSAQSMSDAQGMPKSQMMEEHGTRQLELPEDFSEQDSQPAKHSAPSPQLEENIHFDDSDQDASQPFASQQQAAPAANLASADEVVDFDMDADFAPNTSPALTISQATVEGQDGPSTVSGSEDDLQSFDMPASVQDTSDEGDDLSRASQQAEYQTKIELAIECREIGDVDAARSLLEEVIQEGDADAKAKAQAVLDTL